MSHSDKQIFRLEFWDGRRRRGEEGNPVGFYLRFVSQERRDGFQPRCTSHAYDESPLKALLKTFPVILDYLLQYGIGDIPHSADIPRERERQEKAAEVEECYLEVPFRHD